MADKVDEQLWELEAYDEEAEEAACREYTTDHVKAHLWSLIPALEENGCRLTFVARRYAPPVPRQQVMKRLRYADERLKELQREDSVRRSTHNSV